MIDRDDDWLRLLPTILASKTKTAKLVWFINNGTLNMFRSVTVLKLWVSLRKCY